MGAPLHDPFTSTTSTSSHKPTATSSSSRKSHPPVYSRDFAYANSAPTLLAELAYMERDRENIITASASTFAELLSGPTVDIFVGPSRKHWSLHANLLCHHSTYFEAEFHGHEVPKQQRQKSKNTSEPQRNKLELPDDDPHGFELLVKWVYQGHLDTMDSMPDDSAKYDYAVACHKLHILATKFRMRALANRAMDAYRAALHETRLVPDAVELDEIYRSSPPGSAFRGLMIKIAARQIMDPASSRRNAEDYRRCFQESTDFAVEMVNAIRGMSGGMLFEDPTEEVSGCEWHDHEDGSSCASSVTTTSGNVQRKEQPNDRPKSLNPIPTSPAATRGRPVIPQQQRTPMAELSSERRTPRKLASNPTTDGAQQQQGSGGGAAAAAQVNGVPTRSQAGSAVPSGVSATLGKLSSGKQRQQRQASSPANASATAREKKKPHLSAATMNGATSPLSSKPSSVTSGGGGGGGPRKLAPLPSSSKRLSSAPAPATSNGTPNGIHTKANGIHTQTPGKAFSHGNVNGIVRQLNGVNFDGDSRGGRSSEGGRSRSLSGSEVASSGRDLGGGVGGGDGRRKSQVQGQLQHAPKLKRKIPGS